MRNNLTCSTILVAALAGANPALVAASQTVALPPHPDRVLLQPGECGSAVTGEHRLRWFCAAAVSDDAAGNEAVQEGPPGQARLLEQQAQTEHRLKDVQQQLVAAQNASEARHQQAEAQATQTIAGLREEI